MSKFSCPYLGLENDPKTNMGTPSQRNFCHRVKQIGVVDLNHQNEFCLKQDSYENCEIYQTKNVYKLPQNIISPEYYRYIVKRNYQKFFISLIIFSFLILIIILFPTIKELIQNQGLTDIQTSQDSLIPKPEYDQSNEEMTYATATVISQEQCIIDSDWVPYTVKATDSIFRISILFDISVEDIQAANCMGTETYVSPHETIYIPVKPTATATITFTPTATRTRRVIIPPTATEKPKDTPQPKPTQINPSSTPVPPTATNIPPTATSPPPTDIPAPTITLPPIPTAPTP